MFSLRRAGAQDAEAIWLVRSESIRVGCRDHYPAELLEAWLSAPMPPSFPARIKAEEFVVAESGSQVVGFAGLKVEAAEIDAVFVSPAVFGRKLGARLLAYVEMRAQSLNIQVVHLSASLNAVPFYESAGYVAGAEGWHTTYTGLKIACVHMEKRLGSFAAV
jgi:putative acetyltransferase